MLSSPLLLNVATLKVAKQLRGRCKVLIILIADLSNN